MNPSEVRGAAVGVIGGALLTMVGTLLTWISVAGGFVVIDRSGLDYDGDAKIMLVLAVLAGLGAVGVLLRTQVLSGWVRTSPIILSVVIGVMLINAWVQIAHKVSTANAAVGVTAHAGAGLYVTAAGAVLMLVAGVRMRAAGPGHGLTFNAPPGWQVPRNFQPPAGWQPPSHFPPAPDGWQWWIKKGELPPPDPAPASAAPWARPE